MTDQDKRAVEGLARCGISLQGLYDAFPRFPAERSGLFMVRCTKPMKYETIIDKETENGVHSGN